eukprot:gene10836-11811_t
MKPLLFTVGRFACTSSYIARSTTATIGRNYSRSTFALGFEEFYDKPLQKGEVFIAGREWSAADLRRKSFDDLHKLWYVLYKERNLLLTAKHKRNSNSVPEPAKDEQRYRNVKESMKNIKLVLAERKKIQEHLKAEQEKNQNNENKLPPSTST